MDERTIELAALQVYAQQRVASGLQHVSADIRRELVYDNLVYSLNAFVFGRQGQPVSDSRTYREWRLQRWMPKWLQRKLTVERTVTLDVTPWLVFPEMEYVVPKLGRGVQIVQRNDSD